MSAPAPTTGRLRITPVAGAGSAALWDDVRMLWVARAKAELPECLGEAKRFKRAGEGTVVVYGTAATAEALERTFAGRLRVAFEALPAEQLPWNSADRAGLPDGYLTELEQLHGPSRAGPGGAVALLWLLGLLGAALWARVLAQGLEASFAPLDHCELLGCDFVRYYLPQVRALADALQRGTPHALLVIGWVYPPLLAVLLRPFAALSDSGALAVWLGINALATLALVWLCARVLRPRFGVAGVAGAFGLVTLSFPVLHALKWGQVSVLIAVGAIVALQARPWVRAVLLGVLGAIKIYPLAYLLGAAVRKEARTLGVAAATTAVLGAVVPLLVLGPILTQRLFNAVAMARLLPVTWLGSQGLLSSLTRWLADPRHVALPPEPGPLLQAPPTPWLMVMLTVALALPLLALVVRRVWRGQDGAAFEAALVLVGVTVVLHPAWHHYFAFLPFCQAVALARAEQWKGAAALALGSIALGALPSVLVLGAPAFYLSYSRLGGTTVSALLACAALLRSPAPPTPTAPPG